MGKEQESGSKAGADRVSGSDGESRRDFLRKLTYVAPVIITFQLGDEEAEASGNPAGKGEAQAQEVQTQEKHVADPQSETGQTQAARP
jgi:hypothetical protein